MRADISALVFDFAESRVGHNARRFLGIDGDGAGGRCMLIGDDRAGFTQTKNACVNGVGAAAWHGRGEYSQRGVPNHGSALA